MNSTAANCAQPAACPHLPISFRCTACKPTGLVEANRRAVAEYLANGPLSPAKVAEFDAQAAAAKKAHRAATQGR